MKKSRFTEETMFENLKAVDTGARIAATCLKYGASRPTIKCGGPIPHALRCRSCGISRAWRASRANEGTYAEPVPEHRAQSD